MLRKIKEKIKKVFRREEESEAMGPKEDKSFNNAMMGANDIARSIRESNKLQVQKHFLRRIFHF